MRERNYSIETGDHTQTREFSYNSAGNLQYIEQDQNGDGTLNTTTTFIYDEQGRLAEQSEESHDDEPILGGAVRVAPVLSYQYNGSDKAANEDHE